MAFAITKVALLPSAAIVPEFVMRPRPTNDQPRDVVAFDQPGVG